MPICDRNFLRVLENVAPCPQPAIPHFSNHAVRQLSQVHSSVWLSSYSWRPTVRNKA